jgi:hypothetical protein
MHALRRQRSPLPAQNVPDSAYFRFGNPTFVSLAPIRTPGDTVGLNGRDLVRNLLLEGRDGFPLDEQLDRTQPNAFFDL